MQIARSTTVCMLVASALACNQSGTQKAPATSAQEVVGTLIAAPTSVATVLRDPQVPRPAVTTLGEPPGGLVAIRGVVMPGPLDPKTVNHPLVSGIAKQFKWSDLEPVRGKPDWSQLDSLFGAAEASKKWVRLVICPGMS